jgi:hypothetical protein
MMAFGFMGIKRILKVLAGLVVLGYLAGIGYLRLNERALVFEPAVRPVGTSYSPDSSGIPVLSPKPR